MEAYKEALRAKEKAEKRFSVRDYVGAKDYAMKAQMLYPNLEGISQMVSTFGVHLASEIKVNGEPDCYSVLGLDPSVGKVKLKKQFRKMAALLNPDQNKNPGADVAFKLISEAFLLLSDVKKRRKFDRKRKKIVSLGVVQGNLDTFWTICTSCQVQYEYLRKYLNKKLSCKNCRGVFVAVETGTSPVNGAFPYSNWYGNQGYNNGVTYVPKSDIYFRGNGENDYVSNITFQWGASSESPNSRASKSEIRGSKSVVRPSKKRKFDSISQNGNQQQLVSKTISISNTALVFKTEAQNESLTRRYSCAPPFDARKLLMNRARDEIRNKLEEMNISLVKSSFTEKKAVILKTGTLRKKRDTSKLALKRTDSMPITVPDSDFHDFDKDRSEECFKPKQIWAIYDDEDGMPRLYCIIREIISTKPFKIQISYLNAKTDTEFGDVNWVVFGFTKSCGSFRAFNSDVIEEVNLFSHLLNRDKAGRGGCVRIYPRSGDVWAVYRNWSQDWNSKTPEEVRHRYEMVEVLDDYSEELGLCVAPLVKLDGYKTMYQKVDKKEAIRWIPKREMLRFSHQVPSWPLNGDGVNFPNGCWELDPAATPDELFQAEK